MIALCDEPMPDCDSAERMFGNASEPPTIAPPMVRKSRRVEPSQKPPFLLGRP